MKDDVGSEFDPIRKQIEKANLDFELYPQNGFFLSGELAYSILTMVTDMAENIAMLAERAKGER